MATARAEGPSWSWAQTPRRSTLAQLRYSPALGLAQPGEGPGDGLDAWPSPGWTHGSQGLPQGPKTINGAYYAEWPFDWVDDEHTLGYFDEPDWYLRTQVTQDRLARFALYSEQVGIPLSGAVREVTASELMFAVRYAGVYTWFMHHPESSHCGTCLFSLRGAVHWLACSRCTTSMAG